MAIKTQKTVTVEWKVDVAAITRSVGRTVVILAWFFA
jgi:hypothetical protein